MSPHRTVLERTDLDSGGHLAVLTLDHPPLNLFDQAMFDAVVADLAELTAAPLRALLVRAEGRAVSAGVDVNVFADLSPDGAAALWRRLFDGIVTRSRRCRVRWPLLRTP